MQKKCPGCPLNVHANQHYSTCTDQGSSIEINIVSCERGSCRSADDFEHKLWASLIPREFSDYTDHHASPPPSLSLSFPLDFIVTNDYSHRVPTFEVQNADQILNRGRGQQFLGDGRPRHTRRRAKSPLHDQRQRDWKQHCCNKQLFVRLPGTGRWTFLRRSPSRQFDNDIIIDTGRPSICNRI